MKTTYQPGPAAGATVEKDGDKWTLVLTRDLKHAPEKVWKALTDPASLKEWAPFDADRNLAKTGPAKLTTIGAPQMADITVRVADAPKLLEYDWGGQDLRWQLEPHEGGTRLTLWHNIDRRFIAWGAAGWHICLDVLDAALQGEPIGRMVGPSVMGFDGWQRLKGEYERQFAV